MAIDILGQPAVGRTLCIKGFDLDWTNPISAQVEFRDNLDLLELEQQRNAYTTLTNQTYHNSSYIEAAERKAGQKYRRFGTRFVLDYAWGSHDREISCIEAALSVSVPAARTESYFVNLHTPWTANELTGTDPLAPTAVLSTARFGAAGTLSGTSVLPHKSTWYGRTDSRMVEPDTLTTFYMRVYRGTAANLDVRSFLISGPPGFPLRKCMALEMEMSNNTDHCWTSDDFSLETWRRTFIHGYVQFRVRIGRRVMGRYTIVTTIGGKYASNHFSQTFEFEVADIRSYPTCEVAAAEPSIAPALKTVESCANAFPDGACTWIDKACLPLATLVTLQRDLPSASPPRCVPLGAALPGIISATIKSEHGVPTAGRYLAVRSAGVVVHPPAIGPSLSDGIVNSSQVFLDYAAPGDYRLALSLYNLAPEFLLPALDGQPPVLLAEVRVADRLRGSFDVNPPPLVPKHTLLPCIVVRLTIQRRCPEVDTMLFPTAHDWAAPSVVVAQQEACASFCSLRVVAARTDEYIIDVRVQGTEDVLASSTPVRLVGWGRSMEIMKGVPLEVDSDAALQLSVLVRGADGSPVQDKLVEASIEAAFPSQAMDAGYVGDSRNNVSAEIYSEGSLGVSGVDGVVDMTLWLKRWVAGGPVVIRVKSLLAADVVSTPFIVRP
ncbi:hypothetical protein T484DRAFT_1806654 [Baffinella frigidus]|nr:hypothetical protein T484DRAFT_1806654 [Cryptophyta sp. CCMP2293]